MSDLIADAAANLGDTAPSSTEPPIMEAGTAAPGEPQAVTVSSPMLNSEPSAPILPTLTTGNILLNASPTVDAPNVVAPGVVASGVSDVDQQSDGSVATASSQEVAELPRESHLMLLEAKIAGFRSKLVNAERVALDEFEAIVGHIRAIL